MTYIPLDVYRKLNAKRLLTFGIIMVLISVLVIAVEPASANSSEPWWFLPSKWRFETGLGSNRTMVICTSQVDSSVPPPVDIDTAGKINFSLVISAPNASNLATIIIPKASVSIDHFYIENISGLVFLWGELYATGDGSGLLATVSGTSIMVDTYTKVTGNGTGGYTITTVNNNNITGSPPAGSSLVYLPLELHIWSAKNSTDPTPTQPQAINMTTPMPIYVTTGFTRTVMINTTYSNGPPSMNGYEMNATGVPANPYTGNFTGVATGGGLGLYERLFGLYSNYLFREIMVATSSPPIPSQPITNIKVSLPTADQGDTVNTNITVHNGLAYTASDNITVYANNTVNANNTVIGTQNNVNVTAGATKTLTFTWNTTTVTSGTYAIKAELYEETVIDSNNYTLHDAYPGPSVTVTINTMPEFPPSFFAPLLMIITLAATLLTKTIWSKKQKNIPAAQLK